MKNADSFWFPSEAVISKGKMEIHDIMECFLIITHKNARVPGITNYVRSVKLLNFSV